MAIKLKNPFLLSGYYGRKYFCDREKELNILQNNFKNERNAVLYAWRRMGKTALVKCFLQKLEKKGEAETVYVDLLGTRETVDAIALITQAVHERFGRTSSGMSATFQKLVGLLGLEMSFDANTGLPSFSLGVRHAQIPEKSLTAIGNFLESRQKKIVVAIDEFQQISHYSDGKGEAIFRSWTQAFPGIRFIFCGSHRGLMTSMFAEKNRPFYRSVQLVELNAIDLKDYSSFILKHFKDGGKEISDEAILLIYKWSRAQTYGIQLICNKLYGAYDKSGIAEAEAVCKETLMQESVLFSNYTNLLTTAQWKVLKAIAKDEPASAVMSAGFTSRHNLGAASSINTALKMLMDHELVIKEDNAYLIHDVLLARWLQSL